VGKKEPSYTVGGNVSMTTMENSVEFPQKTKCDPAMPLLEIYLKECK
jgi:hypothetical protein